MEQNKYICIHGHFYQPPRENAWLEEIQNQVSAAPFNNWNERINYECYAPNRAARILNNSGQIREIVNNYENISFNIGPTLISWMEENDMPSYMEIIEADKRSVKSNNGHGNAIAQIYNHIIMPLANAEDKLTQVKWGIYDFESRFGRKPEGMWLSETAVDTATLEVLSSEGILFTILAPRQLAAIRKMGENDWVDINESNIDTTHPYKVLLPSGNQISIFFYDGVISQKVAFDGILNDGEVFANAFIQAGENASDNALINIATDGESYGHHHHYGEMALSSCIEHINKNPNFIITNYGNYLALFPPTFEARIHENSSWSCYHGVERWRSDCGCNTGGHPGWNQQYRKPLRDGLNWLRDELTKVFLSKGTAIFKDLMAAKHDYISVVLNRNTTFVKNFLQKHLKEAFEEELGMNALKLLEMERHANLMFTSCGWFFDEISGLETVQILQYARRAVTHAEYFGATIEHDFRKKLELIPSNLPEFENGRHVYESMVLTSEIRLEQVAMHISVLSIFERVPSEMNLYKFFATNEVFKRESHEPNQLVIGSATMKSTLTWATLNYSFGVLYLGQTHIVGYIKNGKNQLDFNDFMDKVRNLFKNDDLPELINQMHSYFGAERFGFSNLFQDEKINLLKIISKKNLKTAVESFREIYNSNFNILHEMSLTGFPISSGYAAIVAFVLNADLMDELSLKKTINFEKLMSITVMMQKWEVKPEDPERLGLLAEKHIYQQLRLFEQNKNPTQLENISKILDWVNILSIPINLWQSQNEFYEIIKSLEIDLGEVALTSVKKKMNFA
ncbi:MAG: DUF3536 domain-containing protein [Saprospiraceae bacterium]|jgi:alpha-amylase/alpha-mannosidase (GH57 family)